MRVCILLVCVVASVSSTAVPWWSQFGGGPAHVGRTTAKPVSGPEVAWCVDTGSSAISDSPVMTHGGSRAIFGNEKGELIAVDVETGFWTSFFGSKKAAWQRVMDGGITTSPALSADGKYVYVGTDGQHVYARKTATGAQKWQYDTAQDVTTDITVGPNGHVVVGDSVGNVYSLNETGGLQWRCIAHTTVSSTPVVAANGKTYFGSNDLRVYAIPSAGCAHARCDACNLFSNDQHTATITHPLSLGTKFLYVPMDATEDSQGQLIALDPASGHQSWVFKMDGSPTTAAIVQQNNTDVGIVFGTDDSHVYRVAMDGTVVWKRKINGPVLDQPVITGNLVIVSGQQSSAGYVQAISLSKGTPVWSATVDDPIVGSPVVSADGTVLVGTTKGAFCGIKAGVWGMSLTAVRAIVGLIIAFVVVTAIGCTIWITIRRRRSAPRELRSPLGIETPDDRYSMLAGDEEEGRRQLTLTDMVSEGWQETTLTFEGQLGLRLTDRADGYAGELTMVSAFVPLKDGSKGHAETGRKLSEGAVVREVNGQVVPPSYNAVIQLLRNAKRPVSIKFLTPATGGGAEDYTAL